jgi:hypothetical protein
MTTADCTTFAQIAVAAILDFLCEAKDRAVEAAANDPRWLSAVDRAWGFILSVDSLDFDAATATLLVPSATDHLHTYRANGQCQCEAHARGIPCWHRAAARLVVRALALAEQAREAAEQAELTALAQQLVDDAHAAGATWYTAREGLAGARMRMAELADYAEAWDAAAAAQKRQALSARIVAARAAVMSAAA